MDFSIIIIICVVAFLLMLCFFLAVANFAGEKFMDSYKQMNSINAGVELSPLEYLAFLNVKYFDGEIVVKTISNIAGDAYSKKTLFLSGATQGSHSLASFAIISHEMGHALQDKKGKKLKKLNFLRRLGKILGVFLMPLFIAGIVLMVIGGQLFYPGVGLLVGCALILILALFIKLRMIAIEKEASRFALDFLKEVLPAEQVELCRKFLNDARLSYWADFFRTLLAWTFMTRKNKLFD